MSGRHTEHRRRRGGSSFRTTLPLVTVLLVCVTTAVVVTVGLRARDDVTTDARLSLTAQQPLLEPVAKKQRALRGQAAVVSRSATPRGEEQAAKGTTKVAEPKPATVVPGRVIAPMTPAQIDAALRRAAEREAARQTMTFQIGSFNVLGSQHSAPGGDHARYPAASARNAGAVARIRSFGVDILGTQELQPDQLNGITAMTGYAAYPGYAFGSRETDNSILYDDSKFEFVSGSYFTIHFMHANRPQTILRLRDKATGREFYVLNMHASAGEGGYAVTRRAGHYIAVNTDQPAQVRGHPDLPDRRHERPGRVLLPGRAGHRHGGRDRRQHRRRLPPGGRPGGRLGAGLGQRQLQRLHRGPQHAAAASATTTSWRATRHRRPCIS